jgi:hypothetical protein
MADGTFIRYTLTWDATAIKALVADMEDAGLTLAHPTTGAITFIHADGPLIGTQAPSTRKDITDLAALADRDELGFQFWFADGVDVYCRVRRVHHSLYASDFGLTGSPEQRQHVITTVLRTIRRKPEETTAFLVDRSGWALEVDWDAVVQGAPHRITIMPSLLGVPAHIADAHPELRTFPRRDDAGLGQLVAIGELDQLDLD